MFRSLQKELRIGHSAGLIAILLFGTAVVSGINFRAEVLRERTLAFDELEKLEMSIGKLEAQLSSVPEYDLSNAFWENSTPGETIARIQQNINETALEYEIRLRSVAPSLGQNSLGFDQVSLRLEFEGYLDDLVWFLASLEDQEPLLLISSINIRRLARLDQSQAQQQVFVQMTIDAPLSSQSQMEEL